MIERADRDIEFCCDGCGDTESYQRSAPFQDHIDDLKSKGWLITKEDGEWAHYCKDCKDDHHS